MEGGGRGCQDIMEAKKEMHERPRHGSVRAAVTIGYGVEDEPRRGARDVLYHG
jgi:hypothetical protein